MRKRRQPLRKHDALFRQKAMHLIGRRGTVVNQASPHAMQRLQGELVRALHADDAHTRSRDGVADRFGIAGVVLPATGVRLHELGRNQPDLVPDGR